MSVASVKAVVNGQTYNLTYNSGTQAWEATATAPANSSYNQSGHYYGVTITATDDSGNQSVVSATSGAHITNNKPAIQFTVTDADSGVDPDTISIKIDNGSAITSGITKTASGKNYNCSYTPTTALGDGSHTVYINAKDHDGNAATQKTVQFTVDTVAPTLNISSPTEGLKTNQSSLTVSGTTNDATSSPVTVTVKLNSGSAEQVTVQSSGSFSKQITLANGENTIVITATDSAGKSTSVTRHVTLDTGAPVFQSIELVPNPVDAGQTYIIRVKVTD